MKGVIQRVLYVCDLIKYRRCLLGLSMEELGRKLGYHKGTAKTTIWRWEAAQVAIPITKLRALAKELQLPLDQLIPHEQEFAFIRSKGKDYFPNGFSETHPPYQKAGGQAKKRDSGSASGIQNTSARVNAPPPTGEYKAYYDAMKKAGALEGQAFEGLPPYRKNEKKTAAETMNSGKGGTQHGSRSGER